ncbi:hypothetical protein BY458DRAFT_444119 [Sporodiniella umbellata]|nr:hypothetical protein BY458DRAFT_444119 [Sporodiniella umbellata]
MIQLRSIAFLLLFLIQWTLVQARSNFPIKITKGKYFDRIVIIVFENQDYGVAAKDRYLSRLTSKYKGVALTNYLATTHPSQPNYIALISGSTKGTNQDDESNIDRRTIVDLLEAKGISWKTYQEDYPGNCNKKMDIKGYARKHNPFISFKNIQKNKARCAKVVNSKVLDQDIKTNNVPQFVFYTPNVHLCLIKIPTNKLYN